MNSTELADVNVLLALHFASNDHHRAAISWMRATRYFAVTPIVLLGFQRLAMHRLATGGLPFAAAEAVEAMRRLRAHPKILVWPDAMIWTDNPDLVAAFQGRTQVSDFHLLNEAICHNTRLATFDTRIVAPLPKRLRAHVHLL